MNISKVLMDTPFHNLNRRRQVEREARLVESRALTARTPNTLAYATNHQQRRCIAGYI